MGLEKPYQFYQYITKLCYVEHMTNTRTASIHVTPEILDDDRTVVFDNTQITAWIGLDGALVVSVDAYLPAATNRVRIVAGDDVVADIDLGVDFAEGVTL